MDSATLSAANKLLAIFDLLRGTGHRVPEEIGCSDADLSVFDEYYPVPLPQDLRDFLTLVLPASSLDIGVFKSLPPARLLQEQQDAVPFEGNMKHGFFGLGWWTGDADGDGWLYDLRNGRIYAVMLYHNDEESREVIHELAYHDFGSFGEWVDYLYAECEERGWIHDQQPTQGMKFLHIPSRDANDADHLAIMLLAAGLASIYAFYTHPAFDIWWCVLGVVAVVTSPLLWMRVPYAKWGGVLASGILVFLAVRQGMPSSIRDGVTLLAALLIVYWFYKIDYSHRFEDEDQTG